MAKNPMIAAATRERIFAVAKKLGYQRDPMLAALASYRRSNTAVAFHGVLAWVVHTEGSYDWSTKPHYWDYYQGLKERASELGYRVETFDLKQYRGNYARLTSVFHTRNIRGILFCPQPKAHTLMPLSFDQVSAVTMGYTVQSPKLHMVSTNHFASMREMVQTLYERGYRRIGYAVPAEYEERIDRNYLAAYCLEREGWPKSDWIPQFTAPITTKNFRAWLRAHQPDVVIVSHELFPEIIAELKIQVPAQLGVVFPSVPVDRFPQFAGIDDDSREVGRVAAGFLTSLVERGERGIPHRPQRLLVRGVWHDAPSIRPAIESAVAQEGRGH
jgi:DNA-binding LacI/PurR family transcriptional regulator